MKFSLSLSSFPIEEEEEEGKKWSSTSRKLPFEGEGEGSFQRGEKYHRRGEAVLLLQ